MGKRKIRKKGKYKNNVLLMESQHHQEIQPMICIAFCGTRWGFLCSTWPHQRRWCARKIAVFGTCLKQDNNKGAMRPLTECMQVSK